MSGAMAKKRTRVADRKLRNEKGEVVGTIGSGNVWADLGFSHPEREEAKARLVLKISQVIDERDLTQQQAGRIIRLSQPKLSQLLRGNWQSYSLDRLTRYLNDLGVTVRVSFETRPEWREGDLVVERAQV
ncbi:MAG TPA: helix-turn-helix transcriptional regulator [Acetobacteraceae bacterium]|nr:helix-turn-helix transcriptional regulator [Acetobacteraceae bacterium]